MGITDAQDEQAIPPAASEPVLRGRLPHVLTVALEDYYHVGTFNWLIQRGQWYRFESRLELNTRRTLDQLSRYGVRATFFVLGWVADRYPELVRQVAEAGHEIASKGYYHRGIRDMAPEEFRDDLARAREAIERATRQRVLGYRLAHQWLTAKDLWMVDVLAQEGYLYDSSICPALRVFADQPWRWLLHTHSTTGGRTVWEFPLSTRHVLGLNVPIAGGNYFRQFPHWLMRRCVDEWVRTQSAPFVMYFHAWELDAEQPRIDAATFLSRLRHYRNLDKMPAILEHYFGRYRFTSVADYLGLVTGREADARAGTRPDRERGVPGRSGHDLRAERPEAEPATTAAVTPGVPITLVIPVFNEELIIPYLMNTLASVEATLTRDYDVEFLFVDDGSQDGTYAALEAVCRARPNYALVRHAVNRGVAGAIATGLARARTEVVCSMDCDCTYDPHELRHMIPLLTTDVDMVTASPYHPAGGVRNVPQWRLALSKAASCLYRRVLHCKLHTYTSCFRVYRRPAMVDLTLRETRFLGVAEMLALLDLAGGKVVEYPAILEVRMLGRSKMKTVQAILGHLKLIARLLVMRLRGRVPPDRRRHPPQAPTVNGDRPGAPEVTLASGPPPAPLARRRVACPDGP